MCVYELLPLLYELSLQFFLFFGEWVRNSMFLLSHMPLNFLMASGKMKFMKEERNGNSGVGCKKYFFEGPKDKI